MSAFKETYEEKISPKHRCGICTGFGQLQGRIRKYAKKSFLHSFAGEEWTADTLTVWLNTYKCTAQHTWNIDAYTAQS